MNPENGVVRVLESHNLFRFEPEIGMIVADFVASTEKVQNITDPSRRVQLGEFVNLAAAEFALLDLFGQSEPTASHPPVAVSEAHARLGVLKYDCNLLDPVCSLYYPDQFGPNEMTVFSSDISRFDRLGAGWPAMANEREELHRFVRRLESVHTDHPSPMVQSVGRSGVVRLQGLLWRLRFTLAGLPGYINNTLVLCKSVEFT